MHELIRQYYKRIDNISSVLLILIAIGLSIWYNQIVIGICFVVAYLWGVGAGMSFTVGHLASHKPIVKYTQKQKLRLIK